MRNIIYLFTITLCILSTNLIAQDKQDEIAALWDTGQTNVEIYKVDERYIGNPVDSQGERNTDIEILNLSYEEGRWVGKIYARKRNRLLDVECQVKGDQLLLKVDGGLRSRNLEWTKIK